MSAEAPQRARVVVADDAPDLLDLLKLVLERVASDVIAAPDGEAAWRAIQALRPDVAVLDVDLPGRGGVELTRLVRADPSLAGTRVVLITRRLGTDASAAGADRHLQKPFAPSALVRAVRELLALRTLDPDGGGTPPGG